MTRFFSWVMKPWVLSLLGVLLLSLVIWFEAPLLVFDGKELFASDTLRQAIIAILLLSWAGYFSWKLLVATVANRQLMAGVAGAPTTDSSAASTAPATSASAIGSAASPGTRESATEVAVLDKRMRDAMTVLRGTERHGIFSSKYLYQLPWYMFIGAPGSGKTTALVHSGLRFPLAEKIGQNAVGGVGGTRYCDWWFTDEAVLLDTAGRYTTQDSDADLDQAAWSGFLGLLRKHRRRRPINGVIVTMSISDLFEQCPAVRQAQARAIRERIKELHERLGIRFPVYVVVTKCDLLAGFMEFFDNLGRDERAQVWGMTFPLVEAGQVDRNLAAFPAEFQALGARLEERLVSRMQQERDLKRRALLYGFPQQFAAIEGLLDSFLNEVFASTRFEDAALLRGVYFTSGTQEGSPIDRIMGSLAAAFRLNRLAVPANAASGRSYFVTRLLRDVIVKEAGIAGTNLRYERNRRLLQSMVIGAIGVVLALWSGALITSYLRNQNYVADVAAHMVQIEKLARALPATDAPAATLPLLNAIRNLPGGYAERDAGFPWLNRFGLNQGDKLGSGAQALYYRQLREALLPRIVTRMEAELRRANAGNPEYMYELLRVYLMLGDRKHFDVDSALAWIDLDWRRNLQDVSEVQREELSGHAGALLASLDQLETPPRLDAALISQTRLALARLPLPQRIYNRIRREVARAKLPEFSISGAAGQDVSQLFARRSGEPLTRGIPGLFTQAGFDRFTEGGLQATVDVARDSWVLAQQESALTMVNAMQTNALVQQLYFDEYIRHWDTLLADIVIVPLTSLDQSARVMNMLCSAESPLRKFLQVATKETTLDGGSARKVAIASATNIVKRKLDAAKQKLESALSTSIDPALPSTAKPSNPVTIHFAVLHRLVGLPGASAGAPLDQILAMFKDVSVYFDAADTAHKSGLPLPPADSLIKLKREADGKPAPLNGILKAAERGGSGLTQGSERARLNALWMAAGPQFCRQAIAGRYPMVRSAAQEVTLEDFGKFFGPGGLMDDFFQKNLANHVERGGGRWHWRTTGPAALGIEQEVLDEFQRAARVRDMFFAGTARQPSMRFSLKPLTIDPALTKVTLDIDGQSVSYVANKPAQAVQIQVPSGKGSGQVRFESEPAGTRPDPRTDGPWAWLCMIDKGTLESSAQGEHFNLKVDLNGRSAIYDLTASSVVNPFKRDSLERFRCVERL